MRCFYHEDKEAVATCQRCGKSLCKDCASKHSPVYCDECYSIIVADSKNRAEQRKQAEISDSKNELIGILIKGLISACIFGVLFWQAANGLSNTTTLNIVVGIICGFCFPFGWKALRSIPLFYGRSHEHIMIAVMLNFFKFILALLFGVPAFLIIIIPAVGKLVKASK